MDAALVYAYIAGRDETDPTSKQPIFPNPCLTLSLPRAIHFKFPLQPNLKYDITRYEELCFL